MRVALIGAIAFVLCALGLLFAAMPASAQPTVETVGNQFVKAHVVRASASGRFWITAGPYYRDSIRFLYATNPSFVTSNLVFRIARGSEITYYCNQPDGYFPWRPTPSGSTAIYKPFDTMIVSQDTLSILWRGMSGYNVTLRFIAERPKTIYDTGGDILMEFSYQLQPFAPAADLGILMMLDIFNSQGGSFDGGGMGDQPSVMTSNGYLPVNGNQNNARFTWPNVPEWYHVGNFLYREPLNDIFPIHRLSGRSYGGKTLTSPNMFAVGNWYMFRSVAWDLPPDFSSSGFGDCATLVRWEGLQGEGTVRTAFGTNNKHGNNNFTCRDDNIFVDIRTERVITQAVKNGPYSVQEFDVEMWASNLSETTPVSPTIRLQNPITSYPSFPRQGDRLILDSVATPASQTVYIPPRQTVKLRWRLKVNVASTDTLARLVFYARYGLAMERRFLEDCSPLITVRGWQEPPPPRDTLAPRIELKSSGRDANVFWSFDIYDRHPGYKWDLGLSSPLEVLTSENVTVGFSPAGFPSCDTTQTIGMSVTVIDTSRPANLTIRATDCAGNDSIATIVYAPRPDTFPPDVVVVQRSGSYGPPCNVRHYELTLLDQNHQTPVAGDHGFGTVVIETADNFTVAINNGAPVRSFDKRVTVVADVIDSMRDGRLSLRAFDFAGNETIITYAYCALPDVLPPTSVVTPLGVGRWQVVARDRRAWDRGLREIRELSNVGANMRVGLPPMIVPGDSAATFTVDAIDLRMPGEIVLEVRDTIYATEPAGHADTIRISYTPSTQPRDTIAPDITFAPVAGSNGADITVTVDEMHTVNGVRYPDDTGLESIWVAYATPNIELSSAITFVAGDTITTFDVSVIDTLAIGLRDTIVIAARDRAGNVRNNRYIYPIEPDTRAPLVVATMDPTRSSVTAVLSDARPYDRGLGAFTLENASNIEMRGAAPNIRGRAYDTVYFDIPQPEAPVSGTFVLRDLVATIDQTPEGTAAHLVRIPFSLPSVALEIALPDIVEGGEDVVAAIIARTAIGDDVDSLGFALSFVNADAPTIDWRITRVAVERPSDGRIDVTILPDVLVQPGDTIGTLTFSTELTSAVYDLQMRVSNARINGGLGKVFTASVGSDDVRSVVSLPPALIKVSADSVSYVNGDCDRILTTTRMPSKPNALAILGMRPQPIVRSGAAAIELDLRNLPRDGATAELIALDGSVAARVALDGSTTTLTRRTVQLPDVPHGSYMLRLSAATGVDQVMVVIVE
jgi:hypothetical protein